MSDLNAFLTQQQPAGVYQFNSTTSRQTIKKFVAKKSWCFAYLNGRAIADKQTFLTAVAHALSFPNYFGNNWDAFEECLRDLSWLKAEGYVILFESASTFTTAPDWQTAKDILQNAAKEKNLYVLVK